VKLRRLSLPALSAALLLAFAAPSFANFVNKATGTVTCSNYSLEFKGLDLNPSITYSVNFSFTLTPGSGSPITITGSVGIPAGTSGAFDVTTTGTLGPLTQFYTVTSGTATLMAGTTPRNTIPIAFTSSIVSCGGQGRCPATFGYWKHHAFPPSVQTNGLNIGGVTYSAADLLTILNNPGNGNAVTILGPQLVAALLNLEAGATDNPTADAAIVTADSLLSANKLNLLTSVVDPSSALGQALVNVASTLNGYNNANFNTCQEP
jgi:hypothetical protein